MSGNRIWVKPHVRPDGVSVKGFWRRPRAPGSSRKYHEEEGGQQALTLRDVPKEVAIARSKDMLRRKFLPSAEAIREKGDDLFDEDTGEFDYDYAAEVVGENVEGDWALFLPARAIRRAARRLVGLRDEPITDPLINTKEALWASGYPMDDGDADRLGLAFLATLTEAPKVDMPLFRGVADLYGLDEKLMSDLKAGDVIDMPIASWTDDKKTTGRFGTKLLFKMDGSPRAIQAGQMSGPKYSSVDDIPWELRHPTADMQWELRRAGYRSGRVKVGDPIMEDVDTDGYYAWFDDNGPPHEYVTGGRLRVKSVRKGKGANPHVITFTQEAVFDPLSGELVKEMRGTWEYDYLFDMPIRMIYAPDPPTDVVVTAVSPSGVRVELARGDVPVDLSDIVEKAWPLCGFLSASDPEEAQPDVPGLGGLQKAIQEAMGADPEHISKGIKRVRTPEGAKKYGVPIGTPIGRAGRGKLSHVKGAAKAASPLRSRLSPQRDGSRSVEGKLRDHQRQVVESNKDWSAWSEDAPISMFDVGPEMAKAATVAKVAKRMQKDPEFQNLMATGYRTSPDASERLSRVWAQQYINQWASSSGDHQSLSWALQMAVADVFGMKGTVQGVMPDTSGSFSEDLMDDGLFRGARRRYEKDGVAMRAFVRAQYAESQKQMRDAGITELPLWRGVIHEAEDLRNEDDNLMMDLVYEEWLRQGKPGSGQILGFAGRKIAANKHPKKQIKKVAKVTKKPAKVPSRRALMARMPELKAEASLLANPASSWSTDPGVAAMFSNEMDGYNIILSATIPAERVLGTPTSGFGAWNEDEVVVLHDPDEMMDRVEITMQIPPELYRVWSSRYERELLDGRREPLTKIITRLRIDTPPHDDWIKAASLIGKGMRIVRTPEGARKYKVPIGTPIGGIGGERLGRSAFRQRIAMKATGKTLVPKDVEDRANRNEYPDPVHTQSVELFDPYRFVEAAKAGPVSLVGVHGSWSWDPIEQFGTREHGAGFFGEGTYFSVTDPSGLNAQMLHYRDRKQSILAEVTLQKPLVVEGRAGGYEEVGPGEARELIAIAVTNDGADIYDRREIRSATADGLKRKLIDMGYDGIVYLSDSERARFEHGSQIVAFFPNQQVVVKDPVLRTPEFLNIATENPGLVLKTSPAVFDGSDFELVTLDALLNETITKNEPVVFTHVEVTGPGTHERYYFDGALDDLSKAKRLRKDPVRTLQAIRRKRVSTDVDKLVNEMSGPVAAEIKRAIKTVNRSSEMRDLLESWARGDFTNWHQRLTSASKVFRLNPRALAESLKTAFTSGVPGPEALDPADFDPAAVTPDAIRFAAARTGDLIVGVNQKVKDNIAARVTETLSGDISQQDLVQNLRSTLSLDDRMQDAVDKHREGLMSSGVSKRKANKLSRQYADRLLTSRAETIARTEVMKAYNAGQRTYWESRLGDVPRGAVYWEWKTHPDERTCAVCGPMDGVRSGMGGAFTVVETSGAVRDLIHPPVHPNCRCTLTVGADSPSDLAEALHRSLS